MRERRKRAAIGGSLPAPGCRPIGLVSLMNLTQRTASSILWKGGTAAVGTTLNFLILAVLANLLAPSDFGLRGIIVLIIGFLSSLGDLGLGAALIHEERVTHEQFSTLFYLNLLTGLLLTAALFALAPFIAAFFQEERLTALLRVMSLTFLISSASPIFAALFKKELDFKTGFKIEFAEGLANGLVAIVLAFLGLGVWSLAYGFLAGTIVRVVLYWRMASMRPGLVFRIKSVDRFLKFGLFVYGEQILYFFTRNLDNIIIGRFLGAEALGYYSLAYSLMLTPVTKIGDSVGRVIFPAFSLIQHDKARIRESYKKVVKYVSLLTFPMMAGMFAVAPEMISAVYGSKWSPVVAILQVFCLVGAIQSVVYLTNTVQYSQGRTDISFKWNLLALALDAVAFFIGVRWGVMGVTLAYASLSLVLEPTIQGITNRLIGLGWREFLAPLRLQGAGAAVIVVLVLGFKLLVGYPLGLSPLVLLLLSIGLGGVAYAGLIFWKGRETLDHAAWMVGLKKKLPAAEAPREDPAVITADATVWSGSDVRLAIIVPTLDRPSELERLLRSLEAQSRRPDEVVIVDGGRESIVDVIKKFKALNIKYRHSVPPSSARQRNEGLELIAPEVTLVGFLDDDCVLETDALARMLDFWAAAPSDMAGAAFNMMNHPSSNGHLRARLPLLDKIGIYNTAPGRVSASGFHTMIGFVPRSIEVKWLPSGAAVWCRTILERYPFDVWFSGYGYLEDLDLSYTVGKMYRLAVVAEAEYCHFPVLERRSGKFGFGRKEIRNRLHFVRKHPELSVPKCYITLVMRTVLTFFSGIRERKAGHFVRGIGNLCGLLGI